MGQFFKVQILDLMLIVLAKPTHRYTILSTTNAFSYFSSFARPLKTTVPSLL